MVFLALPILLGLARELMRGQGQLLAGVRVVVERHPESLQPLEGVIVDIKYCRRGREGREKRRGEGGARLQVLNR